MTFSAGIDCIVSEGSPGYKAEIKHTQPDDSNSSRLQCDRLRARMVPSDHCKHGIRTSSPVKGRLTVWTVRCISGGIDSGSARSALCPADLAVIWQSYLQCARQIAAIHSATSITSLPPDQVWQRQIWTEHCELERWPCWLLGSLYIKHPSGQILISIVTKI